MSKEKQLIVVGVDGSRHSLAALRWAAGQAELAGGLVHAVMSWEWSTNPFNMGAKGRDGEPVTPEEAAREKLATALAETFPGGTVPDAVKGRAVQGDPAHVLVEESQSASLLVVGTRGYGGFKSAMLGSVSQQVVQYAACTVVVVREES
ncbi:universal stress protein [Actinomycetota bacterium Odt1-20B]